MMKSVLLALALAMALAPSANSFCCEYAPGFQCCGKGPCNGLCCDCGGDACDPNCYGLTYSRHLLANPQPKLTRDEIFKQAAGSKNCIDLPAWTKWVESAKKAHMATTKTSDESSKRYTAVELFKKIDKSGDSCISRKEFDNEDVKFKWSDIE